MKREKAKCYRCSGSGKEKVWVGGRGFFACSREQVEQDCSNCKGTGYDGLESFYTTLERLSPAAPVDLEARALRSGLEMGSLRRRSHGRRPTMALRSGLEMGSLRMPGVVTLILFKGLLFLHQGGMNGFEIGTPMGNLTIQNIGPEKGSTPLRVRDALSTAVDWWGSQDESRDWDLALEAQKELIELLNNVDLHAPPRPFLNYLRGKVAVKDGFLVGEDIRVAVRIDAVAGFNYSPNETYIDGFGYAQPRTSQLQIHLGVTSITLTSREGAEEAYELLMKHTVNKSVDEKSETV